MKRAFLGIFLALGGCGGPGSDSGPAVSGNELFLPDYNNDPNNCGAPPNAVSCQFQHPEFQVPGCCNGACVDFATDNNNCAFCGNVCSIDVSAQCQKTPNGSGMCVSQDQTWQTPNATNCNCGCQCLDGSTYNDGGEYFCANCHCYQCTATSTCPVNSNDSYQATCGGTLNAVHDYTCAPNYTSCPAGNTFLCVYLSSDYYNCGKCDSPCGSLQQCINSVCQNCSGSQILCNGRCITPNTTLQCGGCGACGANQECVGSPATVGNTNPNQYQCINVQKCIQDADCKSAVGVCSSGYCVYNQSKPTRLVFITKNTYSVPFKADEICTAEILAAGLSGYRVRALLATPGKSLYEVASKFTNRQTTPNFVYEDSLRQALIAGSTAFESLAAIADGSITPAGTCGNILPEIDCILNSKFGVPSVLSGTPNQPGIQFWSGSPDGGFYSYATSNSTCSNSQGNWSVNSSAPAGVAQTGSTWIGASGTCNGSYHLLCVQTD